ncbi:hypothetical protein K457DRAFT_128116 [Linnemannia elongata AG-77]|uniref:Carbohydrate-binding module family 48 protein n=1 Tax=Linnemannia elongata AG-77 TaxID=1314771 RepID=A0A197JQH4_9FUNG|nr:hypothetical protein K457DRAFT_128116 [Linnemannia elongata AG-77]
MVTTQIQVLLYVGSRQLVSCSFFVPVPPIVVKSQQRLESILPYLPIPPALCSAFTFSTEPNDDINPELCSTVIFKGSSNSPSPKRDYYYKSSQSNYYSTCATTKSGAGALVKSSSLDSSATLASSTPSSSTALQRYADPYEYPSTTTCIKISLNPKAFFRFLRLRFFRKQNEGFRNDFYYRQHPSYGGANNNTSYYYNLNNKNGAPPRTTPVLFTFPFPSYDEQFPSAVQVTGSFDDWQRDTPLLTKNEQEGRFEAEILVDLEKLPEVYQEESDSRVIGGGGAVAAERDVAGGELPPGAKLRRKLIYKFVLDGQQWVTNASQSLERDHEGNLNNIRFLENVTVEERRAKQNESEVAREARKEAVKTLEVKDDPVVIGLGQSMMTRDGAIGALSTAGEFSAVANCDFDIETSRRAKKRPLMTSMISIEAEDDKRERDGDYGVVILQGEPVTVSTTPMTSLTFFGDHRSAAIERSMMMMRTSVDTMIHINAGHSDSNNAAPSTASSDLSDDSPAHYLPLSNNNLPLSFGSKSAHLPVMNYGDPSRDFVVHAALPTTALSTSVPQLPSMTTLALSTRKKTTGLWKKIKKVLA